MFQRNPLQDPSGTLEHNDTVYVLFDSPCRVFLNLEDKTRIFGNVWSLNGLLVFRGLFHVFPMPFFSLTYFQILLEYFREKDL